MKQEEYTPDIECMPYLTDYLTTVNRRQEGEALTKIVDLLKQTEIIETKIKEKKNDK